MGPTLHSWEQWIVIPWTWCVLWTIEGATVVAAIFPERSPCNPKNLTHLSEYWSRGLQLSVWLCIGADLSQSSFPGKYLTSTGLIGIPYWACNSCSLAAVAYILLRNVLPGWTILVACCSTPISERISRLVAFFLNIQLLTNSLVLCSLSAGRRASIRIVSRVILRNFKDVDGPSTFSSAKGMPSHSHTCLIVSKFCWHKEDFGKPMVNSR